MASALSKRTKVINQTLVQQLIFDIQSHKVNVMCRKSVFVLLLLLSSYHANYANSLAVVFINWCASDLLSLSANLKDMHKTESRGIKTWIKNENWGLPIAPSTNFIICFKKHTKFNLINLFIFSQPLICASATVVFPSTAESLPTTVPNVVPKHSEYGQTYLFSNKSKNN